MPDTMTPELVETDRLTLAGVLTIRDMPHVHAFLRDALAGHPAVTLDCAATTDVDLSFIQLILSARKSADAAGKSVSLIPPGDDLLSNLLARAGLLGPEHGDQDFWLNKVADGAENHSDDR